MNYTKTIEKYGSELWSFNVAGVTFRNKDGEERQEIIERLHVGCEYNVRIERYTYNGEPAYYVYINSKIVGNVPRNVAAAFAAKEDADFWVLTTKAGIHGGPECDDEDYEDRSYGVHMTVKLVSPAEREARHMWVDDEGNLYQDPEVETSTPPKQSTARSARQTAADAERAYVEKHRRARRNVLLAALVVCVVFYAFCMIRRLLF